MATYGYARVSRQRSAEEGVSLEVQERTITGYAMMQGLPAPRMFVEPGVSGSVPLAERPEGKALLAVLKPGDAVITARLDRMFRSALDALDTLNRFKAIGVSLHMIDLGGDVTSNGISKLVFTILSAVAEAERDRIRERICTVKTDQKMQGAYLGGKVPFGFRVEKTGKTSVLVPVEAEQVIIARIVDEAAKGRSLRAIRATLAGQGVSLSVDAISRIVRDGRSG